MGMVSFRGGNHPMKWYYKPLIGLFILSMAGALIWNAGNSSAKHQEAQKEIDRQREVIAKQAFDFNRFNQVAEFTSRNNSLIGADTEKTVIEYREILRREKTCDLPVPADIASGLLDYTDSIRASAMYSDPGIIDTTSVTTATARRLTYCQAVLWIRPLLAAIATANNQLAGIRQIEKNRASQ